jgi:hypothetical protein
VKAPQSASVHCKFSVLSFCTSSLILHKFQSDLYQQNTTPTLTIVALVFLLTYLATCLMSYTTAAPTDAPSVLLPLNDPSFPQPTIKYFTNETFVREPDGPPVCVHSLLSTFCTLLTSPKHALAPPGRDHSIQIVIQKNTDEYDYYYLFYQGPSGQPIGACGWGPSLFRQFARIGPFRYSIDIINLPVYPPPVSLSSTS